MESFSDCTYLFVGITEIRKGCSETGVIETAILCNALSIGTYPNASSYLWWGSFHPSEYMNHLLADDFFNQALQTLRSSAALISNSCNCSHAEIVSH